MNLKMSFLSYNVIKKGPDDLEFVCNWLLLLLFHVLCENGSFSSSSPDFSCGIQPKYLNVLWMLRWVDIKGKLGFSEFQYLFEINFDPRSLGYQKMYEKSNKFIRTSSYFKSITSARAQVDWNNKFSINFCLCIMNISLGNVFWSKQKLARCAAEVHGISKKWDLRPRAFGGTRDPRPGTHLIGGTWDLRPRIQKVGLETWDPAPNS